MATSTPTARAGSPWNSVASPPTTVERGAAELRRARCARPCRRAPGPSPGSRSRCRTPARRPSNSAGSTDGAPVGVDRRRAAGQDDRRRPLGQHLGHRHRVRHDLAVDPRLADPAGDQLRVLRAEVDDEDGAGRSSGVAVTASILPATPGPALQRKPALFGGPRARTVDHRAPPPLRRPRARRTLRSPARFLLWTGRQQWRHSAARHGLRRDLDGRPGAGACRHRPRPADRGRRRRPGRGRPRGRCVVLGLAVVQAVFGILRHRVAVANWLARLVPGDAAARPAQRPGRRGDPAPAAHRRGRRRAATNDALRHRRRVRRHRPGSPGRSCPTWSSRSCCCAPRCCSALVVLLGVPAMVLLLGPLLRPLQRRQHVQREVAGQLTALGADTVAGLRVLRGIGGEPAFLAPLPRAGPRELRGAGVHVAAPQATLDSAQVLLPGHLPGRSSPGSAPGSRSRARSTSATSSRSTATPSSWSSRSVRRSRRPTS